MASAKKKTAKKKTAKKKTAKKKTAKKKTAKKKTAKKKTSAIARLTFALREYALTLPGAFEDYPWDHAASKVAKKVFVFHQNDHAIGDELSFTVKLPHSGGFVLGLPFASATGYGLGKSGWVSIRVSAADAPPIEMMKEWIDESYRAVAPKKKIAELDARDAP